LARHFFCTIRKDRFAETLKTLFYTMSHPTKTGTQPISADTFLAWKENYQKRNGSLSAKAVDLSHEPEKVYVEREQLLNLIDQLADGEFAVFMFGCGGPEQHFSDLGITICGMRAPATIVAVKYICGAFPATAKASQQPATLNDMATGNARFAARNAAICEAQPDFAFMNEFNGYAHEPLVLKSWLERHPDYTHVAIYFGVNEQDRTTIMLAGSRDFEDHIPQTEQPVAGATEIQPGLVSMSVLARDGDNFELFNNGSQCCPIT
jgi:hypothetical protein